MGDSTNPAGSGQEWRRPGLFDGEHGAVADASSVTLPASGVEGRSGVVEAEPCSTQHRGTGIMGDAINAGPQGHLGPGDMELHRGPGAARPVAEADLSGFWSDLEWLACSDGKARPTQPGLFPLAHGLRNRASQLRAYGNAIVPQVAAQFIEAVMEVIDNE